jgi:HlyD family secretion protein
MKRWIIIVLILIVVGGAGYGVHRLRAKAAASNKKETPTSTAEIRTIRETVNIVGEIASALSIEVKSEVSAQVTQVFVGNGTSVTNGQILLALDRSELESQRSELEASIQSASLRMEKAKKDYERFISLSKSGLVTDKDYSDSQIDFAIAENDHKLQRARLKTLDQQLAKTTLYAPCDGMVIQCDAKPGQVIIGASSVSQGTVLMKIVQLDRLIVKGTVNEVDALKLTNGMNVTVTFDSIPKLTLDGVLTSVSPSAQSNDGKDATTKESLKLFPIEISCSQADPRIKLGISANVKIPIAEVKDVVAVSIAGVFSDSTNKVAFVKAGEKFEKRPVEIGMSDALYVEVKKGVAKGDVVATAYPPEFQPAKEKKKKSDDDW